MTRWLRALGAFAENLGSELPAPIQWLITFCNSSSRKSDTLFWPLWKLHIMVYRHTYRQNTHTDTYTIKTNKPFKKTENSLLFPDTLLHRKYDLVYFYKILWTFPSILWMFGVKFL